MPPPINRTPKEYLAYVKEVHGGGMLYVPLKWVKNGRISSPDTQFTCYNFVNRSVEPNWNAKGDYWKDGYVTKVTILLIEERLKYVDEPAEEPIKVDPKEKIEKKLSEAIDEIMEKSSHTRANGFKTISDLLILNHMPEFIESNGESISHLIERSIRYGKSNEQNNAAQLLSVLLVQLKDLQIDFDGLISLLLTTLDNPKTTCETKSKCCIPLAFLTLLHDNYLMVDVKNIINHFGKIIKTQKELASNLDDKSLLYSALKSWSLLITIFDSEEFITLFNNNSLSLSIIDLMELLKYDDLTVRLLSGDTIALIFEHSRQINEENFLSDNLPELMNLVEDLADDNNRYRSKDDRKIQKTKFRDIREYLNENIFPEIASVKFGPHHIEQNLFQESIKMKTWKIYYRYSMLGSIIGGGMSIHLTSGNYFLREFLELGDIKPPPRQLGRVAHNFKRQLRSQERNRAIDRRAGQNEKFLLSNEFDDIDE